MDRRKGFGGAVADRHAQQMIGETHGGGIGNGNGDGPAIRRPGRQTERASILTYAARGQCGFLSARGVGKDQGRLIFYNVVSSKGDLPALRGEGNPAIDTLGKLAGSPTQSRNLIERSMDVGEAQP